MTFLFAEGKLYVFLINGKIKHLSYMEKSVPFEEDKLFHMFGAVIIRKDGAWPSFRWGRDFIGHDTVLDELQYREATDEDIFYIFDQWADPPVKSIKLWLHEIKLHVNLLNSEKERLQSLAKKYI
jgi:hypothetical protein